MMTPEDADASVPPTSRVAIIGAGIAGLLAARALSGFFRHVIVVERDALPDRPQSRPGIPQSAHGHILLVGGVRTITGLFPGIREQLIEAGAIPGDACLDAIVNVRGQRLPRFASDLKGLLLSRNLLEWQIRQRVVAIENVTIRQGMEVSGLLFNKAGTAVRGISVCKSGAAPEELLADLVVDASGGRALTKRWLQANRVEVPETVVDARVGYVSRRFSRHQGGTEDWKVAAISWLPPENRCAGGIYPEENGVWIASLVGALEKCPSSSEDHFLAHARQLEDPVVHDFICQSEPQSKIVGYRMQGSRRRTYSNLSHRLGRLLVLGDALCTVNPFYGQGMTIAALQARALGEQFSKGLIPDDESLDRVVRRAQRICENVLTVPWLFSTTEDFRHGKGVVGRRTVLHRMTSWYVDRAIHIQTKRTIRALFRTMGMVDHYALLRPRVVLEVLFLPILRRTRSITRRESSQRSAI